MLNYESSSVNDDVAKVNGIDNAYLTLSSKGKAAYDLTAAGYFVIPLCWTNEQGECGCFKDHTNPKEIGKAPLLGRGYEDRRLTLEEVVEAWTRYPDANVAILLEPSGLLITDADSEEADREVERLGVPPGPRVKTPKGTHRYFRNESGPHARAIRKGESEKIDVLSKGYAVAPPSCRGTSGYEWEIPLTDEALDDPPQWALKLLLEQPAIEGTELPEDLEPIDLEDLHLDAWLVEVICTGQTSHPEKYPSRSEAVFAVITALLHSGSTIEVIASILLDPRYAISEKPREQGRRWLASDIARAQAKMDNSGQAGARQSYPNGAAHEETTDTLPGIQVNNRSLRKQSDEALEALQKKNNPPFLFYRGGDPVRIVRDERGRPAIEIVGEAALRGYLTRSAEFYRLTQKKEEWIQTLVSPPLDVVRDILTLSVKPFPALVSITECPVLRPNGTIFNAPGYDATTRRYYEPAFGLTVPSILDLPKEADARTARDFICEEVLRDFQFVEQADIANMFGCLLTPIVRPAVNGNVPLCLLNKPTPGSGATLLADVVATIATGQHAAKETMPEGKYSGEEARKKTTSILLAGSPIVVFDNIEDNLTSNALVVMLTTPFLSDRILGESRQVTLPVQATWIATGNNISVRGDLARRCYHVRIDPQVERPWTRDGFRHPDLLAWIREHRGQLLAALLTMARAWFVAGQPKPATPKLGGFEAWTKVVGGILEYAGVPGFLGNLEELYSQVDDEGPQWAAFLETWHQELGSQSVTIKELAGFAQTKPRIFEALPESITWDEDKEDSSKKRLGKALKKRLLRVYGKYRLEHSEKDKHSKVVTWCVKFCGV